MPSFLDTHYDFDDYIRNYAYKGVQHYSNDYDPNQLDEVQTKLLELRNKLSELDVAGLDILKNSSTSKCIEFEMNSIPLRLDIANSILEVATILNEMLKKLHDFCYARANLEGKQVLDGFNSLFLQKINELDSFIQGKSGNRALIDLSLDFFDFFIETTQQLSSTKDFNLWMHRLESRLNG